MGHGAMSGWPNRQEGLRRLRRGLPLLLALTCAAAQAPTAAAEELAVTAQAHDAGEAWLAYAPAPPAGALTLCVVDTGVDLNADLTSAVIGRVALDGGTPDDVDPEHHGTSMAMIAAAARNGVGMIGAWPLGRIFSIRAADGSGGGGPATFAFANYARAVKACLGVPKVAVIELALGGAQPASSSEVTTFVDYVAKAHAKNVDVIAAAGNDAGAVNTPASLPGVLAVGAGDRAGGLCAFSSRGAGLDLIAPGCGLDSADPVTLARLVDAAGSSQASAFAAEVLLALRSYRSGLSWDAAEQMLRQSGEGGVLDAAAAFRAAGLDATVAAGAAAIPAGPADGAAQPAPGARATPRPSSLARFATPRVRSATCRRGRVALRLAGRPQEAVVVADLIGMRRRRPAVVSRRRFVADRLTVRLDRCPVRVAIRYLDRYGGSRSQTTVARIGRR